MAKKNEFEGLYQGIAEELPGVAVAYTRKGNYSVFFELRNPVEQYCANPDEYYNACGIFEAILRTLGDGYAMQKQDIFCRQTFEMPKEDMKFLSRSYMKHFEGRQYTEIKTYLIITQEVKSNMFGVFDRRKWNDFWDKYQRICDIMEMERVEYRALNEAEVTEYLHRFLGVSFRKGGFSFDNFKSMDTHVQMGDRAFKMVDVVDIDEVVMPAKVKPYCTRDNYPVDLFSFLTTVPDAECVIFTQTFIVPNQRKENNRLERNMTRKRNIKDPGNLLAAKDIEMLMTDIATDGKMLVYTNYTVMIVVSGGAKELEKPFNYVEKSFYDLGIGINKCSYNQLELYINSFPGNEFSLKNYERFLCPHDAALCFVFKEHMKQDEDTPLKVNYTDRQGVPVAIDITGKEGVEKLTTNSNFFSLGPSGSGKSFHMNSVVRQLFEQDTDIVMVDTGNSYEGLCSYNNGRYISYTEEKPITMNPFRITEEENNIEKQNFLKSLVFLIWKGADAHISKVEDTLMSNVIQAYYQMYFHPSEKFSEEQRDKLKKKLLLEARNVDPQERTARLQRGDRMRRRLVARYNKLENLSQRGVGGEAVNAKAAAEMILAQHGLTEEEINRSEAEWDEEGNVDRELVLYVENEIDEREMLLSDIEVTSLSFNSFYEFCLQYIPLECRWNDISFNMADFKYSVQMFYRGGKFEKTLNDDFDTSLFEQPFIVFEIDAIKDDPLLFPIVTLIIMDVFIQKMRLKENRKALIIEEAWKAIASPLMAGYIKYLYKTVRKFRGIVGVVTQELDDIISNETVKDSIINNSEILILLDQTKFKERYGEIARLLGISEVEQRKIWSINQLDNHEGRAFFKEVYIRRGLKGEVFGVEESPECYMAYTTERIEKDALKVYVAFHGGDYEKAIDHFCRDWKFIFPSSGKPDKFAAIVSGSIALYRDRYQDLGRAEAEKKYMADWRACLDTFAGAKKKQVFCKYIMDIKNVWEEK